MSSVEELVDKLAKDTLPSYFILITKPSVTLLKLSHDEKLGPRVVAPSSTFIFTSSDFIGFVAM
uniref:Uncharacterized protein n=2 Tax=Lepeophtheirus salmonis TaxID=72036 RepID=A0A0K2VHF5_LEPSM